MSERPRFHAYITRYALTKGVLYGEVEQCTDIGNGQMVKSVSLFAHGEGKDWHRTEQGARNRVAKMIEMKVKTLKKQIQKFESFEFKVSK